MRNCRLVCYLPLVPTIPSHQLTILTPPTVDIRSKAIETPCFGQIGLSFDLSLTGVGPWTVWYDLVYQKAKPQRKSVLLTKPTDHIQIKPTNPGVYTVTFVQVQDSRYPDPVPIQGVSATQLFHAPSSVTLESHDEQLCLGDSAQFAVRVAGSGPWTLTYQLASKSVRTQQVLDNIRDAHYKFMTPPLNESGLHYVELQSVRDANGCTTELKIPGAKVEVYQQRPSASFYSEEFKTADEKDDAIALKMIGGQYTQIPVHFSGHPPFTVGVEFSEDTDGAWRPLAPFTSDSAKGHIRTAKPGTYRLTTIRDHVCTGSVSSPSRARLSTIPQPTVSISRVQGKSLSEFKQMPAEATAICQDEKASVGLTLSGKPPYAVRYRVDYDPCPTTIFKGSSCRVLSEARTFNLAQNAPLLELETAQAGAYVYTLQSVSDDHYSDLPLDDGERSFSLRIHSRPNIQARVASGPTHLCVNSALPKSRGVHLELDGAAPWTVHYDVTHDAGPVQGTVSSTEQTIRRSSVEFQSASVDFVPEDIALTDVGRYRLRLRNITDGNGCHRTLTEEQASQPVLEVIVSAQPDLALLGVVSGGVLRPDERSLSCVGDTIELVVQGIPPFRMDYVYEVNGTVQEHSMNLDGAGVTGGGGLFRDIRLFDHQQRREAGQASGNGVIAKKVRLRLIDEGVVRFRRICHGQSMDGSAGDGAHWCCKELTGVEHFVYGLPSARINAGRHGTDVIREGM